jgi:hypothetical protein
MYGLLIQLGIVKGKPFSPDARMKAILERAARDGKAQMLAASFDSPRPDRIVWPDRRWEWAIFVSDTGYFETPSGLDLEARDRWFMQANGVSPAMFSRSPGTGSLYWLAVRDKDGTWLDGGQTDKLTVPQPGRPVLRPEGSGGQGRPLDQDHPGKGWFAWFRVYGPEAPAFDGSWKPGDFERLD